MLTSWDREFIVTECEYGGQDEQVCATRRVIFFSKQPTSKCNFMKTWQGKSEMPILLKYFRALIEGNCTHWVRFGRRKTNICRDLRSCSAPKSMCYSHRGSECHLSAKHPQQVVTVTCCSGFRASDALVWPLQALVLMCTWPFVDTQTCTHTHNYK